MIVDFGPRVIQPTQNADGVFVWTLVGHRFRWEPEGKVVQLENRAMKQSVDLCMAPDLGVAVNVARGFACGVKWAEVIDVAGE